MHFLYEVRNLAVVLHFGHDFNIRLPGYQLDDEFAHQARARRNQNPDLLHSPDLRKGEYPAPIGK
jgi:hypothetical protein